MKKVIVGESDLKAFLIYCVEYLNGCTCTNVFEKVIANQNQYVFIADFSADEFSEAQKLCPTLTLFLNK